jgi:hypothetical protein
MLFPFFAQTLLVPREPLRSLAGVKAPGVVISGLFWLTAECGKACTFVDGSLGGTGHKEPPDSRPCHHQSARQVAGISFHRLAQAMSATCLWQFGAPIENFQVAVIREEPMPLFAGGLDDHTELHHVLQGLRHGWPRKRKLLRCRRDRDGHTLRPLRTCTSIHLVCHRAFIPVRERPVAFW